MSVELLATGAFLPGEPIDNEQLATLCGPLPDDVLAGLAVERRHWLADPATGEHTTSNSTMAAAAARQALQRSGLVPGDVDLIVLSTASPEYHLPTVASSVQDRLGLERCTSIELRAGCAGAVQALDLARRYLADGTHRTALVIGSEAISPLLVPLYLGIDPDEVRMRDRLNLYNFGDGAAAVLLRATDAAPGAPNYAFASACLGGARKPGMQVIGGGTDIPYAAQAARKRLMEIRLDATGVARFAPQVFLAALGNLLGRSRMQLAEVDVCVLPEGNAGYFNTELDHHQLPKKIVENLAEVGATGSPAVLLALDSAVTTGQVHAHDTVLLVAIEASRYVYAAASLRWGEPLRA